jgi:hypothetical protein
VRIVHRINNGLYVEDVLLADDEKVPADCVEVPMPEGIYKPAKFESGVWATTLTQEEIDALNTPATYELEEIKRKQELMQQAIDDLILGGML